jgi:cell wall-associated NlpC family hydrolase
MSFCRLFPRPLAVCFALSLLALSAKAQQPATRPRQAAQPAQATTTNEVEGRAKLENDLVVVETAPDETDEPEASVQRFNQGFNGPAELGQVERTMLAAIEERLGTPYRMGATGPNRYDCSGFVWSVFQQAGVAFERTSARSIWQEFAPPTEGEKFKFGTLVFFNNLHHVGIVADENGFFHASSSHGVIYARFDEYWTKRISGFRRIPLAQTPSLLASSGR